MARKDGSFQKISVIVPENPFIDEQFRNKRQCLCALDVDKLMQWWPGTPHSPHRNPIKVKAIQRSLDWKRVAQIAAYLLQREIIEVPDKINKFFSNIYEPKKSESGRQWPPKVNRIINFQPSEFPTFSNVLIHVNGAKISEIKLTNGEIAANLVFDENDQSLNFSVIDGQHRINGAFLALCLAREENKSLNWDIPAEIFLDLDPSEGPPTNQAQIFIDVNFYQKKVDRSLVADLFPTARGLRESLDQKERAQDIGRKLMLEIGPLVGMIQIPGIRYGVKDVITLSTLNGAVESVLDIMEKQDLTSLETQTDFIAQCLTAWLQASGRFETLGKKNQRDLDPQNVVYQGRILVSIIDLIPAMLWHLKKLKIQFVSDKALDVLIVWLKEMAKNANLLQKGVFIDKDKFKELGYLGSGGIGRFRDSLWAVINGKKRSVKYTPHKISELAKENQGLVWSQLEK
jgi:DGQHR domain-containing protein